MSINPTISMVNHPFEINEEDKSEVRDKLLREGIFYLKIPEDCKDLVEAGRLFAYNFSGNEQCIKYSDGHFGGYHDRQHNQIQSFYIERREWEQNLSGDLQKLAKQMDTLGQSVLIELLTAADIPKKLWDECTGGVTAGKGQVHFSYNHYRPEKKMTGIDEHRDFGHITILYVEKPGLEALVDKEWKKIDPVEDHFIVLIGREFEILKNDPNQISASWHRVGQLSEERVSFAISYDNERNTPVLQFNKEKEGLEIVFSDDKSYLENCFTELYSGL